MKLTLVFCGLLCAVTAIPGTPSTDPSAYDLRYRIPSGCDPTTNCTYFVGLEVNANDSSFLDVFLTAPVAGWVAVGFSPTPSMVRVETRAGIQRLRAGSFSPIATSLAASSGTLR
jgi:hypothetical protein